MKISVRKQGVPVKSITASTDRLRIGSSDDCEIQLNDPFLAGLIAELVLRDGEWRIVYSGLSIDGCTRNGVRVSDEPVEPGQLYVVGPFEFVSDANAGRRTKFATVANGELIPKTMVGEQQIPMTMVGSLAIMGAEPTKQKLRFEPVANPPAAAPVAARPIVAEPKRSPLVFIVAAALVVIVGGILIIGKSSSSAKKTAPLPAVTTVAPTPPPPPPVDPSLFAKNLDIDKTFAAWEQSAAGANADPQLKQRIVNGAFELGRAYAAANDATNANRYFEKVIHFGQPDSAEVQYVRSRLRR